MFFWTAVCERDSRANDPASMWLGFTPDSENNDVRIIFVRPGFIENPCTIRVALCAATEHNFENPIESGVSVARRTFPGGEMKSRV